MNHHQDQHPVMTVGEPQLLTPIDVAAMLRIETDTLAAWRYTKRYPLKFVKVGRSVRYHMTDVMAFIYSRTSK